MRTAKSLLRNFAFALVFVCCAFSSGLAQKGTVAFFSDNGDPLEVMVAGNQTAVTSVPLDLAAHGQEHYELFWNGDDVRTGWLKVTTDKGSLFFPHIAVGGQLPTYRTLLTLVPELGSVNGVLTIEVYRSQEIVGAATVPSSTPSYSSKIPFEYKPQSGVYTGIAAANPCSYPVDLLLSLYNEKNEFVADTIMAVPANGHVSKFPHEFFGSAVPDQGMLQINSTCNVPTVGFRMKADQISTTPVLAGDLRTRYPAYTLKDMFDNGTLLNRTDPSRLPKITAGTATWRKGGVG